MSDLTFEYAYKDFLAGASAATVNALYFGPNLKGFIGASVTFVTVSIITECSLINLNQPGIPTAEKVYDFFKDSLTALVNISLFITIGSYFGSVAPFKTAIDCIVLGFVALRLFGDDTFRSITALSGITAGISIIAWRILHLHK